MRSATIRTRSRRVVPLLPGHATDADINAFVRTYQHAVGTRRDDETVERHWTFGVNWQPHPVLRLQANYVAKDTASRSSPDLDDDIFYLNVQFDFDAELVP